jgi:hypothetical protein
MCPPPPLLLNISPLDPVEPVEPLVASSSGWDLDIP